MKVTICLKPSGTREDRERRYAHCGVPRQLKDRHGIQLRSLFGKVGAKVGRWQPCGCARAAAEEPPRRLCRERWVCAEPQYVESRLAAMLPYSRCAALLALLMPSGTAEAVSTVRARCLNTGKRLDAEGVQASHHGLAQPVAGPVACSVGLDGGYLRHCHPEQADSRYRSCGAPDFEVVARRVLDGAGRRFAFVRSVDPAADRRVRAAMAGSTGTPIEVFTDGDILLRSWQRDDGEGGTTGITCARHILDWYHLRRNAQTLDRALHAPQVGLQLRARDHDRLSALGPHLQWRLWHGRALEVMRRLRVMLQILTRPSAKAKPVAASLRKRIREFLTYLQNNADSMPDYSQRWHAGLRISSAFAESTVNQVIDKRMSKSQQMRWAPQSAHDLLQVRVRVLDGQLRADFHRWYPQMAADTPSIRQVA
jgi:hypothetical protein